MVSLNGKFETANFPIFEHAKNFRKSRIGLLVGFLQREISGKKLLKSNSCFTKYLLRVFDVFFFRLGVTKEAFDNLVGIHPTTAENFTIMDKLKGEEVNSKVCAT